MEVAQQVKIYYSCDVRGVVISAYKTPKSTSHLLVYRLIDW